MSVAAPLYGSHHDKAGILERLSVDTAL